MTGSSGRRPRPTGDQPRDPPSPPCTNKIAPKPSWCRRAKLSMRVAAGNTSWDEWCGAVLQRATLASLQDEAHTELSATDKDHQGHRESFTCGGGGGDGRRQHQQPARVREVPDPLKAMHVLGNNAQHDLLYGHELSSTHRRVTVPGGRPAPHTQRNSRSHLSSVVEGGVDAGASPRWCRVRRGKESNTDQSTFSLAILTHTALEPGFRRQIRHCAPSTPTKH